MQGTIHHLRRGWEVSAVNLMYRWRQRLNVLTEHILITRREKSILQITLLSLALQELFIPQDPQCIYQFHSPGSSMKRHTEELGNRLSPGYEWRVGKKACKLDPVQITDSGRGVGQYAPTLLTSGSIKQRPPPWDRGESHLSSSPQDDSVSSGCCGLCRDLGAGVA